MNQPLFLCNIYIDGKREKKKEKIHQIFLFISFNLSFIFSIYSITFIIYLRTNYFDDA